jgi:hypothetical protein
VAADVEPYVRSDGTNVWSLLLLERQLRPRRSADGGRLPSPSTDPTDAVTLALRPSVIALPGAPILPPVGRGDAADARC